MDLNIKFTSRLDMCVARRKGVDLNIKFTSRLDMRVARRKGGGFKKEVHIET